MKAQEPIDWPYLLSKPPDIYQIGIGLREGLRRRFFLGALWSLNVYDYSAKVVLNEHGYSIRPGHAALIPPATERVFDWPVPVHQRFCHFALDGWDGRSALRPVLFHIGVSFAGYKEQFDKAASCFTSEPHKTRAIVWELLWRLSEMADIDSSPSRRWMHPSLRAAVARIESSLEEPGSVEDLAREVGVSQSHLIRLFRARFGTTIVGYILRRRVQLAKHLLGHTDCRIKEIAHLVGIPDLHHFNKVIKRATGMAPRDYRRSAGMASEACSREER